MYIRDHKGEKVRCCQRRRRGCGGSPRVVVVLSSVPVPVAVPVPVPVFSEFVTGLWSCERLQRIAQLPRNKNSVLVIDCDPITYENQPDNTLIVKEMTEYDENDKTLENILLLAASALCGVMGALSPPLQMPCESLSCSC